MDSIKSSYALKVILGVIIVIITITVLYYIKMRSSAPTAEEPVNVATTTASAPIAPPAANTKKPTATKIASTSAIAPDVRVAPRYASTVSADQRASIESKLATDRAAIVASADDYQAWVRIGGDYKNAGDYVMAAKVWSYVSDKWPLDQISYNNLGDLYLNYIKDYAKAETYYLHSVGVNPSDVGGYHTLYDIYTIYIPDASKAENILKQGIANNQKAYDLQLLLARFYKNAGRTAEMKVQYDAAIASARAEGQDAMANQIQQEAITVK
jgi:tetratricopeptide (TPR) repeat protein